MEKVITSVILLFDNDFSWIITLVFEISEADFHW